jgi:hypothetical protein
MGGLKVADEDALTVDDGCNRLPRDGWVESSISDFTCPVMGCNRLPRDGWVESIVALNLPLSSNVAIAFPEMGGLKPVVLEVKIMGGLKGAED